jgi:hypothetical protein
LSFCGFGVLFLLVAASSASFRPAAAVTVESRDSAALDFEMVPVRAVRDLFD